MHAAGVFGIPILRRARRPSDSNRPTEITPAQLERAFRVIVQIGLDGLVSPTAAVAAGTGNTLRGATEAQLAAIGTELFARSARWYDPARPASSPPALSLTVAEALVHAEAAFRTAVAADTRIEVWDSARGDGLAHLASGLSIEFGPLGTDDHGIPTGVMHAKSAMVEITPPPGVRLVADVAARPLSSLPLVRPAERFGGLGIGLRLYRNAHQRHSEYRWPIAGTQAPALAVRRKLHQGPHDAYHWESRDCSWCDVRRIDFRSATPCDYATHP